MKRLILLAVALVSFAIPMNVFAQSSEDTISTLASGAQTARIASLKEQYKIKLDDKEKALVSLRCITAQESLQKIGARMRTVKTTRDTLYSEVISDLIQLKSVLQDKQIDASGLDLLIVAYQQAKGQFDTSITSYQIALSDAVSIDCKLYPEDFRAALEGVRASRKLVADASSQVRELTRSNLRTSLDAIKLKLSTEIEAR